MHKTLKKRKEEKKKKAQEKTADKRRKKEDKSQQTGPPETDNKKPHPRRHSDSYTIAVTQPVSHTEDGPSACNAQDHSESPLADNAVSNTQSRTESITHSVDTHN